MNLTSNENNKYILTLLKDDIFIKSVKSLTCNSNTRDYEDIYMVICINPSYFE